MVAITGQAGSDKLHKEAHQVVDIVRMFEPVTKWNTRVERVDAIPEIVRKAFRVADAREARPDPHRAAREPGRDGRPSPATRPARSSRRRPTSPSRPTRRSPTPPGCIAGSERPIVLAGNGVLRRSASAGLRAFARGLHVPVAVTFMGKGAIDDRSHLSLMAVGLQARDHVLSGFDRADLVVSVGYDLVEYAPVAGTRNGRSGSSTSTPSRPRSTPPTDPRSSSIGDIDGTLGGCWRRSCRMGIGGRDAGERHESREILVHADLRVAAARASSRRTRPTTACPIKPQRAIADLRRALGPDDIVVSDVGAHKVWVARLYQAYEPNTVIISNGFAAMGIALPGRDRGQARPPRPEGRRAVRRRRLPDEQPGARDRQADRREHHRRRLARRRLRPHRLEAAQRVRAAVRRRVRQPGLRRLRRDRSGSPASGRPRRPTSTRR